MSDDDWQDGGGGVATLDSPAEASVTVRPRRPREQKDDAERKPQPPYAVIVHDDPLNGMDFVVLLFCKVFGYDVAKSSRLMMEVHTTGRSVVWTGALEVAELKADQIKSAGPDPRARDKGATPLGVTVEPMPGA